MLLPSKKLAITLIGIFILFFLVLGSHDIIRSLKLSSGLYVIENKILYDGTIEERLTRKEEYAARLKKEKAETNEVANLSQTSPEKIAEEKHIFSDAWTAEVRGFLTITNERNPYEESKRSDVAYFNGVNTESVELLKFQDGSLIIELGCIENSKVAYYTYSDEKAGEIEGTAFQRLKKSSADNPVTLTLEKPFYPLDWGVGGANCWTAFKNFQVR